MNQAKTGKFIAELRREKRMTQEGLGEKLGVTNKTISRWENGNYMPNIEMLQMLSRELDVDINELLCGQRLSADDYRENAEENVISVMKQGEKSRFTLKDRCEFFRKKWLHDHRAEIIAEILLLAAICIAGILFQIYLVIAADSVAAVWFYFKKRGEMRAYIENRAFDGKGKD